MEMEDELDFSAKSDELEIHTAEDKVNRFCIFEILNLNSSNIRTSYFKKIVFIFLF